MLAQISLAKKILKTNMGMHDPYQLNFAITYWCNSRCTYCGIWKMKPKNELTLEEIDKFTKKIPFIQWVRLTGGEPFLRKDYVDIVRTFDKNIPNLYTLSTPTNSLAPEMHYQKIREVLSFFKKRYFITLSLDGGREQHDKVRGVEGNFDKVMQLRKMLKEMEKQHKNFRVFFGYTIYPGNVGRFHETFKEVQEIFPDVTVNDFHINLFQVSDVYYGNAGMKAPDDFVPKARQEMKEILSLRSKHLSAVNVIETKYMELSDKYLETGKTPIKCNILDLSCFMDSFGNVYPCIIYEKKLGNIRDHDYDLKKILEAEYTRALNEEIKQGKCPHCWTPCEAHKLIVSNVKTSFL